MPNIPFLYTRLDQLLKYLRSDETNRPLRRDALREAFRTGQWSVAKELIDEGLMHWPEDGDLLGSSSLMLMRAERYEEAEKVILRALEAGGDIPELRYNLALSRFMQGQFSEALKQLEKDGCETLVPLSLLLRARCQYHLGMHDEAIADCAAYLRLAPQDAGGHGVLALFLYDQDNREMAAMHASLALERDPLQNEALLVRAATQHDGRNMESALETYDLLIQSCPSSGRGRLGRALVNMGLRRLEAARSDAELASQLMPEHIGTWHVLGWLQILQNDVKGAERSFRSALALDRGFAETHGGLAVVAALSGREGEARSSIRRARGLDSQGSSVQFAEFVLLRQAGQDDAARELFEAFLDKPMRGGERPYRELLALKMLGGPAEDSIESHKPTLH
jgi:tetratricopeptide (TPR) repeat protein